MSKVKCFCCGNITHEDDKKEKLFYDLQDLLLPVCETCYAFVRAEIEIYKWQLIDDLRRDERLRKIKMKDAVQKKEGDV